MFPRFRSLSLVVVSLILAGCIDSNIGPGEATPIEETTFASALGVDLNASTRTANGAYYRDITVGTGPLVASGQLLQARYTGWLSSGFQFDSNVSAADPYPFTLGTGNVIQGWHETIPGMRVGGKRQLIIPAILGYGPYGSGPIPGNAVIVFNVEIVSAN
jgi:FKBP-type peptidyl-prolyl cis-trans isomerase